MSLQLNSTSAALDPDYAPGDCKVVHQMVTLHRAMKPPWETADVCRASKTLCEQECGECDPSHLTSLQSHHSHYQLVDAVSITTVPYSLACLPSTTASCQCLHPGGCHSLHSMSSTSIVPHYKCQQPRSSIQLDRPFRHCSTNVDTVSAPAPPSATPHPAVALLRQADQNWPKQHSRQHGRPARGWRQQTIATT